MVIKDGTGTGSTLKVDTENRAQVVAVSQPLDQHTNLAHQKVFSLPFDAIDPVGADDYFFYVKNTGAVDLKVTDIRLRSTVVGTVEIHSVSGAAVFTAGTDITPVNRTVGDAKTLTATIKTDTDTTGISSIGTLFYLRCYTANKEEHLRTSATIIIPPGQAIAMLWDTSTGALSGMVSMLEVQPDA